MAAKWSARRAESAEPSAAQSAIPMLSRRSGFRKQYSAGESSARSPLPEEELPPFPEVPDAPSSEQPTEKAANVSAASAA